jgi:hypothetical protein
MQREMRAGKASRQAIAGVTLPAFGGATVCMIPILGALVSPTHSTVYHLVGPASALFVPAVFNVLLLTCVFMLVLGVAKTTNRLGIFLWSCFFCCMPWILVKNIATLYELHLNHRLSLSIFILCIFCVFVSTLLWSPRRAPLYARAFGFGNAAFSLTAVFGFILTLQTCWFGWKARHLNDAETIVTKSSTATATSSVRPLVLWIVFDELSYAQVAEARANGLALPTLDSFDAQSIVFTHTIPAGMYTDVILPALMDGLPDDQIRATADGQQLNLHLTETPTSAARWQRFNPAQTIFADAQSLGYRSAVDGWYNPYCRLLPRLLTQCFWTGQTDLTERFPARTITANLFAPTVHLLRAIPGFLFAKHVRSAEQALNAQLHIDDYKQIYAAADATLADTTLNFVLLHLPIPHPNGIYDRQRHALTTGKSNYLDNLSLVDTYLAHVRETLIQQHRWDNATILIMGDHSWRTKLLWVTDPRWSPEEERASHGGQFDDRPFYALKLPNETTPAEIALPYRAIHTKELLDALLRHQVATPEQLAQWAGAQR